MFPPRPKFQHETGEVQTFGLCPESFQLATAFLQEGMEPRGIAACVVMKACCYLNQAVQESLAMALRFQPHRFECLVRFKEFPSVKQPDPFQNAVFDFHRHLRL